MDAAVHVWRPGDHPVGPCQETAGKEPELRPWSCNFAHFGLPCSERSQPHMFFSLPQPYSVCNFVHVPCGVAVYGVCCLSCVAGAVACPLRQGRKQRAAAGSFLPFGCFLDAVQPALVPASAWGLRRLEPGSCEIHCVFGKRAGICHVLLPLELT